MDSEIHITNGCEVLIARSSPSSFDQVAHHMFAFGFGASPGAIDPLKAILLRPKLSYIGLGLVSLGVLLAAVAPGVLLGVLAQNAELGITLSAAIAGTFALAGNLRGKPGHYGQLCV